MSEQSVASARASVLVYDSNMKKWVPSGSSTGLSKVHIYHHIENNSFRVVGRMVQGHEVVINCSILKGLKYFQATPTFHQWRDNTQIHGLNFASREDAETFALAMERVLDILGHSSMYLSSSRSNQQSQPLYQTIGHSGVSLDDYAEYRGWMNNENGDRKTTSEYGHYRSSHVNQHSSHPSTPGTTPSPSSSTYSHHRASSTPPQQQVPPSPQSSVPPPPPPPPPPSSNLSISGLATLPRLHLRQNPEEEATETSFAAALATAKLKKTPTKPNEGSGSEKGFPMKGMACMLDEMQRTLARRRAQTDSSLDAENASGGDRNWSRQNSANAYSPSRNSGGESPQSIRSRSEVDSERFSSVTATDMLRFREDIVSDLKAELHKVKQEIIDAVRMEMNRR